MLTHNQERFLKSLYRRRQDIARNILYIEDKLQSEKDELKLVGDAIVNLEAEIESI